MTFGVIMDVNLKAQKCSKVKNYAKKNNGLWAGRLKNLVFLKDMKRFRP